MPNLIDGDGINWTETAGDLTGEPLRLNDGSNIVTALQARSHIDSTANPHSVTAAQVGALTTADINTLAELNAILTDATLVDIAHTHTESDITDLGNYSLVGHSHAISDVTSLQTSLDAKVDENTAITGATNTKITYDSKGLVTAGTSLVAADIPNLAASKITSGTFALAQIPTITAVKGGTGLTSYTSGNYINAATTTTLQQRTPTQVRTDIGAAASSHTHTEADITDLGNYSLVGHTHAAGDVTTGTFADALISASSVTQHVTKTYVDTLNVDADTLDSLNSLQFLRSDVDDTKTGNTTFEGNIGITELSGGKVGIGTDSFDAMLNVWGTGEIYKQVSNAASGQNYISFWDQDPTNPSLGFFGYPYTNGTFSLGTRRDNFVEIIANDRGVINILPSGDLRLYGPQPDNTNVSMHSFYRSNGTRSGFIGEIADAGNIHFNSEIGGIKLNAATDLTFNTNIVWHAGNDGTTSGLDADLLDGSHASAFAVSSRLISTTGGLTGGGDLSADRTLSISDGGVTPIKTQRLQFRHETASVTMALSDLDSGIRMDSTSATVVTIPPNSSVAFAIGSVVEVLRWNSGAVSVSPGSGVTIFSSDNITGSRDIATQYGSIFARKIATDTWHLLGDVS